MKRLHVNVAVGNLEASVGFYSSLFGTAPSVLKDDYAKWMLDDPRVNLSITSRGGRKGVDHLGVQVETAEELTDMFSRLEDAGAPLVDQGATTCCYAHSTKGWSCDPDGIAWETFLTTGESPEYGSSDRSAATSGAACCDRPTVEVEREASAPGCCAARIPHDSRAA